MFSDTGRDAGRGGWLFAGCNRDPYTIFQGESNRLSALAHQAQHAHLRSRKHATKHTEPNTSTVTAASIPLPTSSTPATPSTTSTTTKQKKNPKPNYPFNSRPLRQGQPENRSRWIDWHPGLDACTVFPLSPATSKPSLNMQDHVELEDPEDDVGTSYPTVGNSYPQAVPEEILASPPISAVSAKINGTVPEETSAASPMSPVSMHINRTPAFPPASPPASPSVSPPVSPPVSSSVSSSPPAPVSPSAQPTDPSPGKN